MKHKLIQVLIFSFAVSFCFSASSQEKQKPRKFGWSLDQKKKDGDGESARSGQDGKGRETALEPETLRVETALAVFDVLVLSSTGQAVTGLKKEDFEVFVKDQPQEIGTFSPGNEVKIPRSIVLIIDYSLSQLAYIEASANAAKVLVDSLNPQDKMAIVTDDIKLLVPFTQDKEALKKGLDGLVSRVRLGGQGASMQLSALMATLKELTAEEERPIIIQQTDGDETMNLKGSAGSAINRRHFSLEDLHQAAERSGAIVYTVIPGPQLFGLSGDEQLSNAKWVLQMERAAFLGRAAKRPIGTGGHTVVGRSGMDQKALERFISYRVHQHTTLAGISALTGGWTVHLETPAQAANIYSLIFSTIEQRYILGYYPTGNPLEVKPQDVAIRIRNHPEYQILKRKTHYKLGREK